MFWLSDSLISDIFSCSQNVASFVKRILRCSTSFPMSRSEKILKVGLSKKSSTYAKYLMVIVTRPISSKAKSCTVGVRLMVTKLWDTASCTSLYTLSPLWRIPIRSPRSLTLQNWAPVGSDSLRGGLAYPTTAFSLNCSFANSASCCAVLPVVFDPCW